MSEQAHSPVRLSTTSAASETPPQRLQCVRIGRARVCVCVGVWVCCRAQDTMPQLCTRLHIFVVRSSFTHTHTMVKACEEFPPAPRSAPRTSALRTWLVGALTRPLPPVVWVDGV